MHVIVVGKRWDNWYRQLLVLGVVAVNPLRQPEATHLVIGHYVSTHSALSVLEFGNDVSFGQIRTLTIGHFTVTLGDNQIAVFENLEYNVVKAHVLLPPITRLWVLTM
ncbi:hypothetical protein D3C80_1064310 [compost metagenome]